MGNEVERTAAGFGAHAKLALRLLPHVEADGDGSHDFSHLLRVWRTALRIAAVEGGDDFVLACAVLLHDCVAVEKDSPLRRHAAKMAAEKAEGLLRDMGMAEDFRARVRHAIEAHSFSAGVEPVSVEARILRDADRLDAIGAVGIARCFYVSGRLSRPLYDPADPLAARRRLDDLAYALDHFPAKLLRLGDGMKTAAGVELARRRMALMERFLAEFHEEIGAA